MIVFRPSADFGRKLKLSSPLPDLPLPENPLFDWCVRPFRFGRYGFVLFTHTTTLFTLLTLQRGITTPKALRRAFAHAVNDYMTSPKRGSAQASALLAGLTDCQFARCTNRKVTGSINDQVWRAKWILNDGETNFTAICDNLNYTPMGALGMEFPDQRFPALPLS